MAWLTIAIMAPVQAAVAGLSARLGRALALGIVAAAALALLAPAGARALDVPDDYQLDAPIDGLTRPSAIAFASNGDVFIAERIGTVKVFHGINDPQPDLVVDIRENVHAFNDRGMMGMALDPDYPAEPYLYLSYTRDAAPGEGPPPTHEENSDGSDTCVRIDTGELDEEGECIASARVSRFDVSTAVGGGGALGAGDEQDLVTGWCQQFHSHSMDDLEFDEEGALLVSGGEAANYAALDYGQFGNPCGDPEFEGGSLRSQDLRGRWNDPVGYNGTIIRIDPETGAPWPTNTPTESESDAARIVAYGLRNPFRMALRPGTDELFTTDVGSSYFDEVNRIPDLLDRPNGWPLNFGWPCREGFDVNPGFHALSFGLPLPICVKLYEEPPVNLKSPHFAYPRSGELFAGDKCNPTPGAALAGLSFYELPGAPQPGALPKLDGSLLLADAARGCVWEMDSDGAGKPDPGDVRNLITREDEDHGAFTPVNFATGPGGDLFIPDFWGNRIVRLRYFEDNKPPEAEISALPHPYGLIEGGKFTPTLDAGGSSDAEDAAEDLEYEWDLDGDGTFEETGAEPTVEAEYTEAVNVVAQLRVTDSEGATDVARITLYPGDLPPSDPTMTLPTADRKWNVGEEIEVDAPQPTDPADEDDGEDPQLDWDITIQHCPDHCHSHPHEHITGTSGSFAGPDHEYPSHLRIVLTATDSRGLSAEPVEREIFPNAVDVTLQSDPPGVPLTIASSTKLAPFAERLLSGGDATVSAPQTATLGGHQYNFASWSDGGARNHLVSHTADTTLIARYAPPPVPDATERPDPLSSKVRLRFATWPGGLPLRVGKRWRRARFGLSVQRGSRLELEAPRRLVRRGRVFAFKRWKRIGRKRMRNIKAGRSRTYVAIFRSRPLVRDGKREALSWRRPAK